MSTDDFRSEAHALLSRLLDEAADNQQREMMLEVYAEEFTKLHRDYAHSLLNDVISDVPYHPVPNCHVLEAHFRDDRLTAPIG